MVSSIAYAPLIGWEILAALAFANVVLLSVAAWLGLVAGLYAGWWRPC